MFVLIDRHLLLRDNECHPPSPSSGSHNPCMLCNLSYLLIFFRWALTNTIVPWSIWHMFVQ
jgi:hypothetical protein